MFRKPRNDPGVMFYDKAEEERCKRYEHRQYRNLVLKALLTFVPSVRERGGWILFRDGIGRLNPGQSAYGNVRGNPD